MAEAQPERLKSYVEMISRSKGGVDALVGHLRTTEEAPGGLEGMQAQPSAQAAAQGLETVARGATPPPDVQFGIEAIIAEKIRPAVDIVDGRFVMTHPLWKHMSDDAEIRARVEKVIPSVGRIELPGNHSYPYGGTGFVVGNGLIMTNRHVAQIFATGLGDKSLNFITGEKAGIDFLREKDRQTGPTLMVQKVVLIHPYWDMAILAVDGLSPTHPPLKLSLKDARDLAMQEIFVIGYPAFDPRNPTMVQNDLFRNVFGVKRLQPGELQGGMATASFGKTVNAATHDCSTLGGNSGSAIFDMATGEVLGLHFGGAFHEKNYGIPSFALSQDARVVDTGVNFASTPSRGPNTWGGWWTNADAGEAPAAAGADSGLQATAPVPVANPGPGALQTIVTRGTDGVTIDIPLRITISLGGVATVPVATPTAGRESVVEDATIEKLVAPFHDTDYSTREGYDQQFLGSDAAFEVPMPTAADPSVIAKTKDGEDTLAYQNFSIAMHGARRLAIVCASNISREAKLRRPDPNQAYTRRGLSGLGQSDQELWIQDPRLDDRFQIPDVFFTKDKGAFDKGHIVRREDVAWGSTYEELRRANGDTYHVTNCSPQVAGFNRSASGEDNWGDLENAVFAGAATERLCVFAGPVLSDDDQVFVGTAGRGVPLRAKTPWRFWKVIAARTENGIAAFGFVLEQELGDVPLEEFVVPPEFLPKMAALSDIAEMTGVAFPQVLLDADQFSTSRGDEVASRSGTKRRNPKPKGQGHG